MPDINPEFLKFKTELESLIQEMISRLKTGNFTNVELAQLSSEIDFFEELKQLGFEELINKYFDGYDTIIEGILDEAQKRGVRNLTNINIEQLTLIKELDKEILLRSAAVYSAKLESELMKSIIRGEQISQTVKHLQDIPLTDTQLSTVLNTAYSDLSRTATVEIYKEMPEQRFSYEGGLIPTSSDICTWLYENQKPEGYTMKEIQAGIVTPFGIVNELGREPNFNCIHRWVSI